jgi:hypothetical protein
MNNSFIEGSTRTFQQFKAENNGSAVDFIEYTIKSGEKAGEKAIFFACGAKRGTVSAEAFSHLKAGELNKVQVSDYEYVSADGEVCRGTGIFQKNNANVLLSL